MRRILLLLFLFASTARADGDDIYLPSAETGGNAFVLNPQSQRLRALIKRKPPEPDDLLDARALADDLVFLRQSLRKEYAGYAQLLQTPGFDVEALFDERIDQLRHGPEKISYEKGLISLFLALRERIVDLHLSLPGTSKLLSSNPRLTFAEYQLALDGEAAELERCSGDANFSTLRQILQSTHDVTRPILTVSAHPSKDTLQLRCGQRELTLHRRESHPAEVDDKRPIYEWHRLGDVGVITIRRFSGGPAALAMLRQLAEDYPLHRQTRLLVFDLRGNGGGDDSYLRAWIDRAKRGPWRSYVEVRTIGGALPWYKWNALVWQQIQTDCIDQERSIKEREAERAKWPRRPSEVTIGFDDGTTTSNARAPYSGRIVVLVDRATASSGESGAEMLQEALGAKLVGERTAGFREFGNQRVLVLPHTGVSWKFATKRNYYRTPVEGVGLPVDYYLSPEEQELSVEALLPTLRNIFRH